MYYLLGKYIIVVNFFLNSIIGLFEVCKSVHHHTIQINHQPDATISRVYNLTFIYSSTCFGRPHAHHQELNNCSSSCWVGQLNNCSSSCWVGRGRADRPDHDHRHCYHHAPKVKPEADTAVVELLMLGVRTPETCWAVNKRQVINWRDFYIWLANLFELVEFCCYFNSRFVQDQ